MVIHASKLSLSKQLRLSLCLFFVLFCTIECSRITRAVMMNVSPIANLNCSDLTITEKNRTAKVILTGTVINCDIHQAGSYKCHLQVWRVMKGKKFTSDLLTRENTDYTKNFGDVYGFGNLAYCESNVKDHDTRIFFLDRSNNRLILSASVLRITLLNLQNTQAVIEGQKIVEIPKKPLDPCLSILCGYGARCEARNGLPLCVCPDFSCTPPNTEEDLLAPVCGSDGVTYANECRLKDVQCMTQRRIKIIAQNACEPDCEGRDRGSELCQVSTTDPVLNTKPCSSIACAFSAQCHVSFGADGRMTPSCVCPTCDANSSRPVCGSDQKSYSSECEMRRTACLEGRDIEVVRNSSCDPCQTYSRTRGVFERTCKGECLLAESGESLCCSDIECDEDDVNVVCGSDGNNYESRCALKRYACKTARNISVRRQGSCPEKLMSTVVRGSIALAADCPGNCDPDNASYNDFVDSLQYSVNRLLMDDENSRTVSNFEVLSSPTTRNTLMFKASASTASHPVGLNDSPTKRYEWIENKLVDDAISVVLRRKRLATAVDVKDGLLVEDVCLGLQCEYGAVCVLSEELAPSCSCEGVGDGGRQPVDVQCMVHSAGKPFLNVNDARASMCSSRAFFPCEAITKSPERHPCEDIGGCDGSGEVCSRMNDESRCECQTCNDIEAPVCGSDDQTYKSECELLRHNCLVGGSVAVQRHGHCDNPCAGMKCLHGAQCVVEADGTACVCPKYCTAVYSPVCGSDCVTYNNECKMMMEGCETKTDITVAYRGTCDEVADCHGSEGSSEGDGSGESMGMEGSGGSGGCRCKFGARCDGTDDDEDTSCVCAFNCEAESGEELCGSDLVTYTNRCELERAECEKQAKISILGQGSCNNLCQNSRYGCCRDGVTSAKGPGKAGCLETCACNSDGSFHGTCDLDSGECVCRPGVGGKKCDRCLPGFWNFQALVEKSAPGCMACSCDEFGSRRDDCDATTGQCFCKEGVVGAKCSKCERDGSRVDSTACSELSGSSCDTCPPGQECFNDGGVFVCRCPTFAECDGFSGSTVCGSDGLTYPDACQMRVMTCKQGVLVRVHENGKCKESTGTEPPGFDISVTTTPTTTPTTDMEIEGSAKKDCGLTDDEDCFGSGDKEPDQTDSATTTVIIDGVPTTTILTSFSVSAIFKEINGTEMKYDSSLSDPSSTLYEQYSYLITYQMNEYVTDPVLSGEVKAFRIVALESTGSSVFFWITPDVKAIISISYDPRSNPEDILELMNRVSNSSAEFAISEQTGIPSEHAVRNRTFGYEEGGSWSLPQFGGYSFLEHSALRNAFSLLTIKITFRTFDSEGLLLYASQTVQDGDFVSLAVKDSYLEFRFDAGNGPLVLKSNFQVSDGRWHDLVAHRNRREGVLDVDGNATPGTSPAGAIGLEIKSSLFLGGFPSTISRRIRDQIGVGKGLTGCIAKVSVQDIEVPISSNEDRIFAHRIGQCVSSPCFPSPCNNTGNCFIVKSEANYTYKCDCMNGFQGNECSERVDHCLKCHPTSLCRREGNNFSCDCAPGRSGPFCQVTQNLGGRVRSGQQYFMPGFAGDSYIIKSSLGDAVRSGMEIILVFYSRQAHGLIFYNAQKKSGKGDFVALFLSYGYLFFMFNLGSGELAIRSRMPIKLEAWHEVRLTHNRGTGQLTVDEEDPVTGRAPVGHKKLDLNQPLYLGGIPLDVRTPPSVNISTGLTGALQKFEVNGKELRFGEDGYNVQPSNAHYCFYEPCENGGICHPSLDSYTCECVSPWTGVHCEDELL